MANTMPRSLRIPEDVWRAAVVKAEREGITVTTIVTATLRRYLELSPDAVEYLSALVAVDDGENAPSEAVLKELDAALMRQPR